MMRAAGSGVGLCIDRGGQRRPGRSRCRPGHRSSGRVSDRTSVIRGTRIDDANGGSLAYVYVQDEPGGNYDGLTENEARQTAVNVVRLPELLLKERLGCASAPN